MGEKVGSVVVVGGGVAGIEATLQLANQGFKVYMVESSPSIGGRMAQLDKTFPTNDCAMCILSPKLVEVGRHKDVELMTMSRVLEVSGEPGNLTVQIERSPRYVDPNKCVACGVCAEKCPVKIPDEFNGKLIYRKAAYLMYPQAVPLKYAIDEANCIYINKKKCGACEKKCPAKAINFNDKKEIITVKAGALLLAPGFKPFDPKEIPNYGYGTTPDIVTSLEFERILSASGPFQGHLVRPSDHKEPKKIAWIQCVGSRDINKAKHSYCSSVCCMYAIKQAIIAKEHASYDLDTAIFFMDMRTHGKGYEQCYNDSKERHKVRFIRARIHSLLPNREEGGVMIHYADEDGVLHEELFDMAVLSIGLEVDPNVADLAERLGIRLSEGGFCDTQTFEPVVTSRPGVFVCGAFQGPKDIPQSVIEAGAAAQAAGAIISSERNSLIKEVIVPKERDIRGERPKVGVFVCSCGINIGGVVDVKAVAEYAKTLPFVTYSTVNLYSCSQDTQNLITKTIQEQALNRIVVAACSPKTHEPLFQETMAAAGLNKYLMEFVNIRNHDSWVHKDDPKAATEKAKDLIRMAVSKVLLLEPSQELELPLNQRALIIGGGLTGLTAAIKFAESGFECTIVEREEKLGGNANFLFRTHSGEEVEKKLLEIIDRVQKDPKIEVLTGAEIKEVEGYVGNFKTKILSNGSLKTVEHGVTVVATGAHELQPKEYLYGVNPNVITGLTLDMYMKNRADYIKDLKQVVFIQCVGSREPERPYCSRVCCTHTVVSALHLKEINPDIDIFVLYRDLRTYGEREILYKQAREKGVLFIRYDIQNKPQVEERDGKIIVKAIDHVLKREVLLDPDLLVLQSAIVPGDVKDISKFYKVPVDEYGFFVEAHVKLAPSSFATEGVFLAGLAHYPKPIDESIAQAGAAVANAVALLSKGKVYASGVVAEVDVTACSACGVCAAVCPYNAPSLVEDPKLGLKAQVNPFLCKGCGLCNASCRSNAIHLKGYKDGQVLAMIQEFV